MLPIQAMRMRAPSVAGPLDPSFANVASLMHLNGTNGSTTFTDVKGKTWAANGSAQISTAQSVFGGGSLLCDGNGDFIQTTSSLSDFEILGDFSMECRVRFNAVGTGQYFAAAGASGNIFYLCMRRPGSGINRISFGINQFIDGTTDCVTGTWYAVAVTRTGSTLRLFINGIIEATTTNTNNSSTVTYFNLGCAPAIAGATAGLNGWLDEFRFTKGVCRYTANYTPEVVEFPDA